MASRVSWSDLPEELIAEIAKRLESPIEIGTFRLVSKAWLSVCPLSPKLLSLFLPYKIPIPGDGSFPLVHEQFVLTATNTFLLHPLPSLSLRTSFHSKPWMVRVEELSSGLLQIQRPLTHNRNVDLPNDFPMGLNFSQIRLSVAFRGFHLRGVSEGNQGLMPGLDANKVVMYNHRPGESPVTLGNFTALVLFFGGRLYAVSLSDGSWELVRFGRVSRFDDVLNFRGSIVVLDRKGRLYRLCCTTLACTCIVPNPVPSNSVAETRKHLVEMAGELYVLHYVNFRFRVFKMIEVLRIWAEVYNLGWDRLLFVGPDCCFPGSIEDYPSWRGNSIVYHIDSFRTSRRDDDGVYPMYNNPGRYLRLAVYQMGDMMSEDISSCGYSDVFWPPPQWLRHPDHRRAPPRA